MPLGWRCEVPSQPGYLLLCAKTQAGPLMQGLRFQIKNPVLPVGCRTARLFDQEGNWIALINEA